MTDRSLTHSGPSGSEMTLHDLRFILTLAMKADFKDEAVVRVVNTIRGRVKSMTIKEES